MRIKTLTEEHKKRISNSLKGHHPKSEFKKGHKVLEETRKKIGLANKGKLPWTNGKHHSEESKSKMSLSKKGHKVLEETRKKIGLANKGKHPSEEARKKMSIARKGLQLGEKHPNWKGGRIFIKGYIYIYFPNHPYNLKKYVAEHRLVMEKHLGRVLLPTEVVHHINGNTMDNRIENLMLFSSNGEHHKFHNKSGVNWKNIKEVRAYRMKYYYEFQRGKK